MTLPEFDLQGDLCGPLVLLAILLFVGRKMVEDMNSCRRWGLRLAALAFLAFLASGLLSARSRDEAHVVALRSLFHAGLVLGAAWIILPVCSFIVHHTVVAPWRGLRRLTAERRRLS